MEDFSLPDDALTWLRGLFRRCNEQVTKKLSNNPQVSEESLDHAWIEKVSRQASAIQFPSRWTARIQTHFLGGMVHYGRWEIADIGVLLFVKRQGVVVLNKTALLQSKRLYPQNAPIEEEHLIDYQIGIGRLADPEVLAKSLAFAADFTFDGGSRYGAVRRQDQQVKLIEKYEAENELRVYYQFYNPWQLPLTRRVPVTEFDDPPGKMELGTRIIPSTDVRSVLDRAAGASPAVADFSNLGERLPSYGWPLEDFICDEFLACREGDRFDGINDARIERLFYRRSGPIAAAIAITLEAP